QDTLVLKQVDFNDGFYAIQQISKTQAEASKDRYSDTLMLISKGSGLTKEPEPFRMLTTAFIDDGRYYKLRVINSMVEKDDLVGRLFRNTIWLYFLLIVSIIVINNL